MKPLKVSLIKCFVSDTPQDPVISLHTLEEVLEEYGLPSEVKEEIREAAKKEGFMHPELMASALARYSRNGEGLENILSKIDLTDPDAVDKILKFADYGHASIKGLTGGIPIAIDGLSMIAAYRIFAASPKSDGQESSSRYIEFNSVGIPEGDYLGLPPEIQQEWFEQMLQGCALQEIRKKKLDAILTERPELIRYPEKASEAMRGRMNKNFGLDRSRYFLPFTTQTGMAIIMTGREWSDTIKYLDSWEAPEYKELANKLRKTVSSVAPRVVKHSFADNFSKGQVAHEVEIMYEYNKNGIPIASAPDHVEVDVLKVRDNSFMPSLNISGAFRNKENRYHLAGYPVSEIAIRRAWNNVAIAELRDLNRHRTGIKYAPFAIQGFYIPATEAIPQSAEEKEFLERHCELITQIARSNPVHMQNAMLLGDQVPYRHTTTADKVIYEAELRTGPGAHFRYAEHERMAIAELEKKCPEIIPFIQLGEAEPEGV